MWSYSVVFVINVYSVLYRASKEVTRSRLAINNSCVIPVLCPTLFVSYSFRTIYQPTLLYGVDDAVDFNNNMIKKKLENAQGGIIKLIISGLGKRSHHTRLVVITDINYISSVNGMPVKSVTSSVSHNGIFLKLILPYARPLLFMI